MRIKVRVEEVLIGGMLGAGFGLAVASPLASGVSTILFWQQHAAGWFMAFRSAFAFLAMMIGAIAGAVLAGTQEAEQHVRGVRYTADPAKARTRLQISEARLFSRSQRGGKVQGIKLGGVELARKREVGHLYVVGQPGSGKTVLLKSTVEQAIARGDRVILHDPKGDYTAAYYDQKNTILLGPWDERAAVWDAATDMDSPALVEEFAVTVAGKVEGQNKFFHDAAATIISGLIQSYALDGRRWTWADLGAQLSGPAKALILQAVKGNPQVQTTMPSVFNNQPLTVTENNILQTVTLQASWLLKYAAVDAGSGENTQRFALRAWLAGKAHEKTRLVILNSSALYEKQVEAIFGAMLAVSGATIASAAMPERPADERGMWFILDEFPQLGAGAIRYIQQIAEMGRSRGVRMVMALQAENQLPAVLGRDKGAPVLEMQAVKVYLRCSDATAEAVSRRLGDREIMRLETTAQTGAIAGKQSRADRQRVINPSDLLSLQVMPNGVELLMHIESEVGKLVQPFGGQEGRKTESLVESELWKSGKFSRPDPKPEAAPAGDGERKIEPVVEEALRRTGYKPSPRVAWKLPKDADYIRWAANECRYDPKTIAELLATEMHNDEAGAREYATVLVDLVASGWKPGMSPDRGNRVDWDWI